MTFQSKLSKNMENLSRTALLRTIFESPTLSIGKIRQDLEDEENGQYLVDIFDSLTIDQIVSSAAAFLSSATTKVDESSDKRTPQKEDVHDDEEEDDFEDEDDEEEDDDDDEDDDEDEDEDPTDDLEDEEEEDESPPRPARPQKRKKRQPPRSSRVPADGHIDLSEPNSKSQYQAKIVAFLKKKKATSDDSAISSKDIRDECLGDAKQCRDNLNDLIESGRVKYTGQARGTKYYLYA